MQLVTAIYLNYFIKEEKKRKEKESQSLLI
jgi:hypothetical protein